MQEPGTLNDGPGFLLNVVFQKVVSPLEVFLMYKQNTKFFLGERK
jgi:hypothetical protein